MLCGLRLDELAAELEDPVELRFSVRNVDVDVDRHLDGLGLLHSVEEEARPFAARIGRDPAVACGSGLVVEQCRPEPGEAFGIVAGERDVEKPKHVSRCAG